MTKQTYPDFLDDIKEIAGALVKVYDEAYEIYKPMIDDIIKKRITDKDIIEHYLDMAMDILTDKGYHLFLKLCNYYQTVDEHAAQEYLELYDELYGEEEKNIKQKEL